MVDRPTSPPKLQRFNTTRDNSYTFPIQPHVLLRDLMNKVLLHPLEHFDDDTPMGCFDAYCTYHQRKGHATNFYKILEATILELVEQGRYKIDESLVKQGTTINVITIDKEIYANLRRGYP